MNIITIPEKRLNRNAKPVRIEVEGNGCWRFLGYSPKSRKPQIMRNGKYLYVHRFLYEFYHGKIPPGYWLVNLCGNERCCNPAHYEARQPIDVSPVLGVAAKKHAENE